VFPSASCEWTAALQTVEGSEGDRGEGWRTLLKALEGCYDAYGEVVRGVVLSGTQGKRGRERGTKSQ
jgi:hypothetical protein